METSQEAALLVYCIWVGLSDGCEKKGERVSVGGILKQDCNTQNLMANSSVREIDIR